MKLSLDEITKKVMDIPALPMVVNDIMRITEDPDSTIGDIEKTIMKDQSLTARILRLANSIF